MACCRLPQLSSEPEQPWWEPPVSPGSKDVLPDTNMQNNSNMPYLKLEMVVSFKMCFEAVFAEVKPFPVFPSSNYIGKETV